MTLTIAGFEFVDGMYLYDESFEYDPDVFDAGKLTIASILFLLLLLLLLTIVVRPRPRCCHRL